MAQMGFFDVENRYAALDAKNDPLVRIHALVPWEAFRSRLENVWRKPPDKRKSNAGCKPWDAIVMFKAIILCALYNLSDDQVEYQMRDRLSFVRFLGLALQDKVPDAKTVWLYREQLSQAGVMDALFEDFDGYLKTQGYQAMGGQCLSVESDRGEGVGCGKGRNDTLSVEGPSFHPFIAFLRVHDKHFFVVTRCVTRPRCRFWRKISPTTPQISFYEKKGWRSVFQTERRSHHALRIGSGTGKDRGSVHGGSALPHGRLNPLVGKRDADLPLAIAVGIPIAGDPPHRSPHAR